ncbi:Clavaminate synthase-like protein [Patellaria atrata CBS 101060]|uniref:Clavaminate synthase-like protein n=1 Tax=Patellaria atrata CBS 101060 TaxID=1346257 RepID=A0A9P4S4F1_9PEZI|nr:Clavaminate synthase-like protein [Patellaria atrata CBS 101060]
MPPLHKATVGNFETYVLPKVVEGTPGDKALAKSMIDAWHKDGILQVAMDPVDQILADNAFNASKQFFARPCREKEKYVDDQSFSGYIASGEEITDGVADYSEIFTVTKDLPLSDPRVQQKWPCHGPCPWPSEEMQNTMNAYMAYLGDGGEKILQLIALGLNIPIDSFSKFTRDGWHHMRVLRFPQIDKTNGKGKTGRGIGSHTDYGLLVIAAQEHIGGLYIRPPYDGEKVANWETSAAGLKEDDEGWVYVPPVPGVFTVFPGDMMQYVTDSYLPSTPHKVGLNTRERFALAYFHEPNFSAVMRPLKRPEEEGIHYGTHFTNMFMRNYPTRVTAKRMLEEGRMDMLKKKELKWE